MFQSYECTQTEPYLSTLCKPSFRCVAWSIWETAEYYDDLDQQEELKLLSIYIFIY